jgi:hypothetical protein
MGLGSIHQKRRRKTALPEDNAKPAARRERYNLASRLDT